MNINLNFDIATWIDYFIGAFVCCIGCFFISLILVRSQHQKIKFIKLLLLIPLSIYMIFNNLSFDNIFMVVGGLLIYFIIFKFILMQKTKIAFMYSVIAYIILGLGEIIYILLASIIELCLDVTLVSKASTTLFTNIIISVIACLIALLISKIVNKYIKKLQKNFLMTFFQILYTLIIIVASINYLYLNHWTFNYRFVLLVIVTFCSTMIMYSLIKEYIKNKEVTNKYQILEEYLKNSANLIEQYSSTIHKYKNQLIIIKGYVNSNNKEAIKYVDGLLDNMKIQKYKWVSKINYIPIDTIKYLVYYKLSQAETLNLNILVTVSKEIKLINYDLLNSEEIANFAEIIGEYFDNAIYASNESKDKEIVLNIYIEDNFFAFSISNTFANKVNINYICKNGYTTKGKNHGYGLYDVEKTLANMNNVNSKYEIIDNYFVATLKILIKKYTT